MILYIGCTKHDIPLVPIEGNGAFLVNATDPSLDNGEDVHWCDSSTPGYWEIDLSDMACPKEMELENLGADGVPVDECVGSWVTTLVQQ